MIAMAGAFVRKQRPATSSAFVRMASLGHLVNGKMFAQRIAMAMAFVRKVCVSVPQDGRGNVVECKCLHLRMQRSLPLAPMAVGV